MFSRATARIYDKEITGTSESGLEAKKASVKQYSGWRANPQDYNTGDVRPVVVTASQSYLRLPEELGIAAELKYATSCFYRILQCIHKRDLSGTSEYAVARKETDSFLPSTSLSQSIIFTSFRVQSLGRAFF